MKRYLYLLIATLSLCLSACEEPFNDTKVCPEVVGQWAVLNTDCKGVEYILCFENGEITESKINSPVVYAENKLWGCTEFDFEVVDINNYSVSNGMLSSHNHRGYIYVDDDTLTINGEKYYRIIEFKSSLYHDIVIDGDTEIIVDFGQNHVSKQYSVRNADSDAVVSVNTECDWITNLKADTKGIEFTVVDTKTPRSGEIILSYLGAKDVAISIKQQSNHLIQVDNSELEFNYHKRSSSLTYTVTNPVAGSKLSAVCNCDWITNIDISEAVITFNIAENNSNEERSTELILSYPKAEDMIVNITQTSDKPIIKVESVTLGYEGGELIIPYSIDNARDEGGITIESSSDTNSTTCWVHYIKHDASNIYFTVDENYEGTRTTDIKVQYMVGDNILSNTKVQINQYSGIPTIVAEDATINYEGGEIIIPYSILNSHEFGAITVECNCNWVHYIKHDASNIYFTVDENYEGTRTTDIKVQYMVGDNILSNTKVQINQYSGIPTIVAEDATINYEGGEIIIPYSILNSHEFGAITVECNCNWVHYIKHDASNIYLTVDENYEYIREEQIILNYLVNENTICIKTIYITQGYNDVYSDTIFYTTRDTNKVSVSASSFGADVRIISHTYDASGGIIIFDKPIKTIGYKAFDGCTSLTSITIPNCVTTIGEQAFTDCDSLTSITIPNSVTTIGEGAFANSTNLKSVTIPNSVTTIGEQAFKYCDSLTSITIPNNVTEINYQAFLGCKSLKSVTIPNSVTKIGQSAFTDCDSLTSITIPNSVTTIGEGAFRGCDSLTYVTIPKSTSIIEDEAFWACKNIKIVYCMAITPPNLGDAVFKYYSSWNVPEYPIGCMIYVPMESVDKYKYAVNWEDYSRNIVGYDF